VIPKALLTTRLLPSNRRSFASSDILLFFSAKASLAKGFHHISQDSASSIRGSPDTTSHASESIQLASNGPIRVGGRSNPSSCNRMKLSRATGILIQMAQRAIPVWSRLMCRQYSANSEGMMISDIRRRRRWYCCSGLEGQQLNSDAGLAVVTSTCCANS
jgi:hypothetical protein